MVVVLTQKQGQLWKAACPVSSFITLLFVFLGSSPVRGFLESLLVNCKKMFLMQVTFLFFCTHSVSVNGLDVLQMGGFLFVWVTS